MHEKPETSDRIARIQWRGPHYVVSIGMLIVGIFAGRAFFPLEVPKPFIVEKEKRVEVPVERVVEKRVEVPVDRILEKRVEVPVEKIVYRDIPKVVEKKVIVPVEIERVVYKSVPSVPPNPPIVNWLYLKTGMTKDEVLQLVGAPTYTSNYKWHYKPANPIYPGQEWHIRFYNEIVDVVYGP